MVLGNVPPGQHHGFARFLLSGSATIVVVPEREVHLAFPTVLQTLVGGLEQVGGELLGVATRELAQPGGLPLAVLLDPGVPRDSFVRRRVLHRATHKATLRLGELPTYMDGVRDQLRALSQRATRVWVRQALRAHVHGTRQVLVDHPLQGLLAPRSRALGVFQHKQAIIIVLVVGDLLRELQEGSVLLTLLLESGLPFWHG